MENLSSRPGDFRRYPAYLSLDQFMNHNGPPTEPYHRQCRKNVIDVLELLASPGDQIEYQNNVPHAFVPDELICMWFDDSFRPNDQRLKDMFAENEWSTLLEFNSRYDELHNELPSPLPQIDALVSLPQWQSVISAAKIALRTFNS